MFITKCNTFVAPGQTKTPCPVGTYSDVINLATDDSCLPCKQGYYCDEPGQQESAKTCKNGHYCGGGAKVIWLF